MGTPRARQASGLTLDAGALIALERGDERVRAVLALALREKRALRIPAGVVGQVWRNGGRQAVISRLLKAREVDVQSLDDPLARAAGELCGVTGPSDVIDASVVLTAREHGDVVLTSDPGDLRRLDRTLRLERV